MILPKVKIFLTTHVATRLCIPMQKSRLLHLPNAIHSFLLRITLSLAIHPTTAPLHPAAAAAPPLPRPCASPSSTHSAAGHLLSFTLAPSRGPALNADGHAYRAAGHPQRYLQWFHPQRHLQWPTVPPPACASSCSSAPCTAVSQSPPPPPRCPQPRQHQPLTRLQTEKARPAPSPPRHRVPAVRSPS